MTPLVSTGHFVYESGHHGDTWLALDRLIADPSALRAQCRQLAAMLPAEADLVCGPLDGGAFVAQFVAEELGAAFAYTRRELVDGTPRYLLPPALEVAGRRAAVVDDAINLGSATLATIVALTARNCQVIALASLLVCQPSGGQVGASAGVPQHQLTEVHGQVWPAATCPLCHPS